MDHRPRTTNTNPAQNGMRRDNPASQSRAACVRGNSVTTMMGRDSARPNSASETKPVTNDAPPAPLAAAIPSSAKMSGAAQAGMLNENRTPSTAEPLTLDSRDK